MNHLLLFTWSVVSNSLWHHGLQHARFSCPSSSGACSNSCPLSWWGHPAISSSIVPFSSCLPSYPAPGSLLMNQFFISGGQSIEVSASASVLPMSTQDWFPLGLTGLISLQSKELSRVFSNLATVKRLRKSASDTSIWVLQQRIRGRGLFQKGPIRSCWVTFPGI